MFQRTARGIEIAKDSVRAATIFEKKGSLRIEGSAAVTLPEETLRIGAKEPNILSPANLIAGVRTAVGSAPGRSPFTVALPDAAGRVLLVDLDTRVKSRAEGADMIRWRLRKNSNIDLHGMQLDYQVLEERENGGISAIAGIIHRDVVTQYEEVLSAAGVDIAAIEFSSFSLYRFLSPRLDLTPDAVVISFRDGVLTVAVFTGGILRFYRSKDLRSPDAGRLFQEVASSLLTCREKHHLEDALPAFICTEPVHRDLLMSVAGEAAQTDAVAAIDCEKLIAVADGTAVDSARAVAVAACAGAAARSF